MTAVFIFATTIFEIYFSFTDGYEDSIALVAYVEFDAFAQGLYLVLSVLYLRRKINQVNLHASTGLIVVHVVNFVILSVLVFANEILYE